MLTERQEFRKREQSLLQSGSHTEQLTQENSRLQDAINQEKQHVITYLFFLGLNY